MMLRIAADYDRLAESSNDLAAHDSIMFRKMAEVKPESLPETPEVAPKIAGRAVARASPKAAVAHVCATYAPQAPSCCEV